MFCAKLLIPDIRLALTGPLVLWFMDMHQWFWAFWNDVKVSQDDVDQNFTVHVWRVEHIFKFVLIIQYQRKFALT